MATQKLNPEGLLGVKLGMTQVYDSEGQSIPVTIIQTGPCVVLDVKNQGKHGYSAVQLGIEARKNQRVNRAQMGHFAKAGKGAFYHVKEMRCDVEALGWNTVGQEVKATEIFTDGDTVDISGISKGRGFSGVVRRHKVKGQPSTRGTHETRRNIGSIGCRKFPGRVFKGQRMPGQMGNADVTIQNITLVSVRPDDNVILVKGGIPGPTGSVVMVRKAMKGYKSLEARKETKAAA